MIRFAFELALEAFALAAFLLAVALWGGLIAGVL